MIQTFFVVLLFKDLLQQVKTLHLEKIILVSYGLDSFLIIQWWTQVLFVPICRPSPWILTWGLTWRHIHKRIIIYAHTQIVGRDTLMNTS